MLWAGTFQSNPIGLATVELNCAFDAIADLDLRRSKVHAGTFCLTVASPRENEAIE
jgi:hypothetical protein